LGLGIPFFTAHLVDPKDAMFVRVEGQRLAVTLQVGADQAGVIMKAFLVHEKQSQEFSGGIINQDEQCAGGPAIFEPGVRRSVHLHQFPKASSPLAHLMHHELCNFMRLP